MSGEWGTVENLPCIDIWTDGSCDNVTNVGGYAAVLRCSPHEKRIGGPLENTTSQRCEMTAAIEALKTLKRRSSVVFYTDSRYLMDGATKWAPAWLAKGKLHIKPNCDLWSELLCLMEEHEVRFEKVLAHSGVEENELVDRLANEARLQRPQDDLRASESPAKVLDFQKAREARTEQPDASRSTWWPAESEQLYARFGREVARLYPYVQHNKEEVPKVMTPLGPGTVKQAFTDGVKVLLDKEEDVVYPKSGKAFSPMRAFAVEEVWPLEEKYPGRGIGNESSYGPRVHGLRGDRQDKAERSGRGGEDKALLQKRSNRGGSRAGTEEGKVDAQREASESDAQLTLL